LDNAGGCQHPPSPRESTAAFVPEDSLVDLNIVTTEANISDDYHIPTVFRHCCICILGVRSALGSAPAGSSRYNRGLCFDLHLTGTASVGAGAVFALGGASSSIDGGTFEFTDAASTLVLNKEYGQVAFKTGTTIPSAGIVHVHQVGLEQVAGRCCLCSTLTCRSTTVIPPVLSREASSSSEGVSALWHCCQACRLR
jgi:hypothetical protein